MNHNGTRMVKMEKIKTERKRRARKMYAKHFMMHELEATRK